MSVMTTTLPIGFQIEERQILFVDGNGAVYYGQVNPETHIIESGVPIFKSIDDHDMASMGTGVNVHAMGVALFGEWSMVLPRGEHFASLRDAYQALGPMIREVVSRNGYTIYELTSEQGELSTIIPAH